MISRGIKTSHPTSPAKRSVGSMATKIPTRPWLPWKVVVVTSPERRKVEVTVVYRQELMIVIIEVCQVLMIQMCLVLIMSVMAKMVSMTQFLPCVKNDRGQKKGLE